MKTAIVVYTVTLYTLDCTVVATYTLDFVQTSIQLYILEELNNMNTLSYHFSAFYCSFHESIYKVYSAKTYVHTFVQYIILYSQNN